MNIDRKRIRKYFVGRGVSLAVIGAIVGFIITMVADGFVSVLGILLLLAGIAWIVYVKILPDVAGEKEVDKAIEYEIEETKKRAFHKLNIIAEQINSVQPIVVSGRGFEPKGAASVVAKFNVLKRLLVKLLNRNDADPVYRLKIGSDDITRCSLLEVTVFMFGEKQIYIYFANVDLCTGFVYSEGTNEMFYSDISGLKFTQDRERIFNPRKLKFYRVLFEGVELFANGCTYQASISTGINNSLVEAEFAGMRTLIRERKNAD